VVFDPDQSWRGAWPLFVLARSALATAYASPTFYGISTMGPPHRLLPMQPWTNG